MDPRALALTNHGVPINPIITMKRGWRGFRPGVVETRAKVRLIDGPFVECIQTLLHLAAKGRVALL